MCAPLGTQEHTSKLNLYSIAKVVLPSQRLRGIFQEHLVGFPTVAARVVWKLALSVSMLGSRRYAHHRRPAAAESEPASTVAKRARIWFQSGIVWGLLFMRLCIGLLPNSAILFSCALG